ncbi:hypothetical protein I4U23_027298 [Adineta vaga]|nr:hypothetical protein I4U23_027298 [Adineta vaga]
MHESTETVLVETRAWCRRSRKKWFISVFISLIVVIIISIIIIVTNKRNNNKTTNETVMETTSTIIITENDKDATGITERTSAIIMTMENDKHAIDTTIRKTTETTSTKKIIDPCAPNSPHWNITGITLLPSSQLSCAGLFIDSDDTLYGADSFESSVWKKLKDGMHNIIVAGSHGSNKLISPADVYVDRYENLYVADTGNSRIVQFMNEAIHAITIAGGTSFTESGNKLNQLNFPQGFAFDSTETFMYVADSNNHRVLRFPTDSTSRTDGVIVAGKGVFGNTNEFLQEPSSIYLSSTNNDLFIVNRHASSVIRWTPGASSGTYVAGIPFMQCHNSSCLHMPAVIKMDSFQNMYIVDQGNHRVQMFCKNSKVGVTVAGNGVSGSSAMHLAWPSGMAFDSEMNMYVCDKDNKRVQKFTKL